MNISGAAPETNFGGSPRNKFRAQLHDSWGPAFQITENVLLTSETIPESSMIGFEFFFLLFLNTITNMNTKKVFVAPPAPPPPIFKKNFSKNFTAIVGCRTLPTSSQAF